jgi:cysteine synthase
LSLEKVAFLLKLMESRGEIRHGGIVLEGTSGREKSRA